MKTKKMIMVALLGAISAVLMVLEFPVPFAPPFIKMDFSELPIILGGYMMGPLAGLAIIVIKIALSFVLNGTTTGGVGELANMVASIAYMLPAVLIYRKLKTRKGAALSLVIGTLIASVVIVVANTYVLFPVYAKAFGMELDAIVAMGTAINSHITDLFTMMMFSILPFNLFKYGCVSLITFLVYKRLRKLLHSFID